MADGPQFEIEVMSFLHRGLPALEFSELELAPHRNESAAATRIHLNADYALGSSLAS